MERNHRFLRSRNLQSLKVHRLHIVRRQHSRLSRSVHCSRHPALVDERCVDDDVPVPEADLVAVLALVVVHRLVAAHLLPRLTGSLRPHLLSLATWSLESGGSLALRLARTSWVPLLLPAVVAVTVISTMLLAVWGLLTLVLGGGVRA